MKLLIRKLQVNIPPAQADFSLNLPNLNKDTLWKMTV